MTTATELRKEIQKARNYLNRLESQLRRVKYRPTTEREAEERRMKRLESELRRAYPNIEIDRSILKLVGTLPKRGSEKRLIAEAIAEKYAR